MAKRNVVSTPPTPTFDYDLIVIGCGPAGQRAAVQAAKIKKRVAIIERRQVVGGVCVNAGTIPSKSFREAVLGVSRQHNGMKQDRATIDMADLTHRCQQIVQTEIEVVKNQLLRNRIDVIHGHAQFTDPHTLTITPAEGPAMCKTAEKIIIAVGAKPQRQQHVAFDGTFIFDSDDILTLKELPQELVVVGGGVIGTEYASMFAALGVHVTLVDVKKRLLSFVDEEISETLQYQLRSLGVTLRLGEEVKSSKPRDEGGVVTELKSGKVILSDCALFAAGRVSATDDLQLSAAGLTADERGTLAVNDTFQTVVPHIYAAGDVIGFPALASTSGRQGRLAARHAYALPAAQTEIPLPFAVYAIPEISFVGMTEEEATKHKIPYETGIARYREIARGLLLGDENGVLKILFHRETQQILGVHIIGQYATELIHIGQAVIALKGTLQYFIDAVVNYPTLAECYKVAALDGYNKIA